MTARTRLSRLALPACLLVALVAPGSAGAATTKTYQVTGPVLAVTDASITVQKGKEKWEIARSAATKGPAEVKVGDKVTIEYTMTATSVEVKGGGKPEKTEAAPKK